MSKVNKTEVQKLIDHLNKCGYQYKTQYSALGEPYICVPEVTLEFNIDSNDSIESVNFDYWDCDKSLDDTLQTITKERLQLQKAEGILINLMLERHADSHFKEKA